MFSFSLFACAYFNLISIWKDANSRSKQAKRCLSKRKVQKKHMWGIHAVRLTYRCTLPLHGTLMSLIHEIYFFQQQSTPPSGVCTEQISGCSEEWTVMKETVHQQLFICTESLCPEIAGEGRIDTKVVDTTPTKATNSADASEIWPSAFVAQAAHC